MRLLNLGKLSQALKFLVLTFLVYSTSAEELKVKKVTNFDGVVWGMDFLNADLALVTLRHGHTYLFNLKTLKKTKLQMPLKIETIGQGGLLDVKFHNDSKNVYYSYSTKNSEGYTTALARGEWDGKTVKSLKTIFVAKTGGSSGRHFGSRLIFHKDSIFMTIGDRREREVTRFKLS